MSGCLLTVYLSELREAVWDSMSGHTRPISTQAGQVKVGESQTPVLDKPWFVSGVQSVLWDPLRGHMKIGLSYLEINSQSLTHRKSESVLSAPSQ